jgi:hypothetical protein
MTGVEGPYFAGSKKNSHPAVVASLLLVLVLSLFCGVSRMHCGFVLAVLRFVVRSMTEQDHPDGLKVNSLINQIPRDPRTLFNHFDLHPRLRTYICCPDCYALYDNDSSAPQICTYQDPPDTVPCGSASFSTRTIRGKDVRRPLRLYVAQNLKEWVGSLLARESVEKHLKVPVQLPERPKGMRDFWEGRRLGRSSVRTKTPFSNVLMRSCVWSSHCRWTASVHSERRTRR